MKQLKKLVVYWIFQTCISCFIAKYMFSKLIIEIKTVEYGWNKFCEVFDSNPCNNESNGRVNTKQNKHFVIQ